MDWRGITVGELPAAAGADTTITMLRKGGRWAMGDGEVSPVPAARDADPGPHLFANWGKVIGQWSQWMEQRFLVIYTVSFEGRSLP